MPAVVVPDPDIPTTSTEDEGSTGGTGSGDIITTSKGGGVVEGPAGQPLEEIIVSDTVIAHTTAGDGKGNFGENDENDENDNFSSNPASSAATFDAANPGSYAGGSAYATSGACFVAGTMVEMADGTTKAIETIDVGEHTRGGIVQSTMKNLPEKIYDYKGVKVSGSHYVMEDGQFVTVGSSKHGIETEMHEVVYNFIVSEYRIFIKGIEFGAYYTQNPEVYADWAGGMERLNEELRDGK